MNSITLILLLGLIYVTAAKDDDDHNWDYARRGPDVWRHDYKACAGLRQSPINIDPDEVEYDKTLKPFKFHNYDKQFRWNVSHNGHTVVVSKIDNDNVSISGSNFDQPFKLLQFHFHWGYNDYQGSEHYVDQEKYPLEMHLVHQAKNGDITVIGVLFKLIDTDNTKLNPLMNAISHTNFVRNWREVRLNLSSILPNVAQMDSYYRYVGSLTTPPCTENVVWTIMKTFVEISPHQLLSFRTNQVRSNYREPQKMFNRKVTSSFTVQRKSNAKKNNEQAVTSLSSPPLKFNFLVAVVFLAFSTIFSRHLL